MTDPLLKFFAHAGSSGVTGLYRRFLNYAAHDHDPAGLAVLKPLLDKLASDAERDRGLARACHEVLQHARLKLPLPEGFTLACIASGALPEELHRVMDDLQEWLHLNYSGVDEREDGSILFRRNQQVLGDFYPPPFLIGRLFVLAAKHYGVSHDQTKPLWWMDVYTLLSEEFVKVWPAVFLWMLGWFEGNGGDEPGRDATVYVDGCAEWCWQGCPQLVVHQPLAAAFALTDVPTEMVRDIELPWNAFRLLLPKSPLVLGGHRFEEIWVWRTTAYAPDTQRWVLGGRARLTNPDGTSYLSWWQLTQFAQGLHELAASLETRMQAAVELDPQLQKAVASVSQAICNVVLSAVLHLSEGHYERAPVKKAPKGKRWRAPAAQPETTDYVLSSDIKLTGPNLAPVVEAICSGERKFGKAQWLVRGHKRWQACGPRHTLRKCIWIQPYWKGPVDAPILKRSHEMET